MIRTPQPFTRIASFILMIILLIVSLAPVAPASAQPATSGAFKPGQNLAALTIANVSAPEVNYLFDFDGLISVNDITDTFSLIGTTGNGVLQTRLWPKGQPDTSGAGLYIYLYRVDMRNVTAAVGANANCVASVQIPFGPIVKFNYDNSGIAKDIFVITQGSIGSVAPTSASSDVSGNITFYFGNPGVCAGSPKAPGDSSFFFGMASRYPYRSDVATVLDSTGHISDPAELNTRVPIIQYGGECLTNLVSPRDMPSPALINFDSQPADTYIVDAYSSYGMVFGSNVKTMALAESPGARSTPNVATADTIGSALSFTFPTSGVTHVGFYGVNTLGLDVMGYAVAYGKGVTGEPIQICALRLTMPKNSFDTFFGFYDPQQRILSVNFSIPGQEPVAAQIDDLNFAPGQVNATEFPRPKDPLGAGGPEIITRGLDNTHFGATFNLPDPNLWIQKGGDGLDYLRFGLPGVEINGNGDGYPDIPIIRRLIAYPEGANLMVTRISATLAGEVVGAAFPSQPPAVDEIIKPPPETYDDPPFVNPVKLTGVYPPAAAGVEPLGKMRDLNLALVTVYAGQYDPFSKLLQIYKNVDVDISFEGGAATFLTNRSFNAFEPDAARFYSPVLNHSILTNVSYIDPSVIKQLCATELYIATTPALLPAAQSLAAWKVAKGISTAVVQYSSTAATNRDALKAFLQNKYDNCMIRPSYLLILADTELINPFAYPSSGTNSDLGFATLDGPADYLPDLAYGRIPVDTLAQANIVVNKIIAYEKTPPATFDFYKNFSFASFFEWDGINSGGMGRDSRSFVESAETARAALTAAGKNVDRIYKAYMSPGVKPAYYLNGAPLPAAIGPSSSFAWNGTTADVVSAFNTGRGLIFHRDHGWPGGWGDPAFELGNLTSLTNGNLTPVVYSVNCASGVWDNELGGMGLSASDVSWSEQLLRMNGGAVSLIGDLRNSPTWANSALARGLFDATWPSTDPAYGTSARYRRLGDILNYAKLYMLAQVYIPQTAGSVSMDQYRFENLIYHVIGDPTLELWTGYPYAFTLPKVAKFVKIVLPARPQRALAQEAYQVEYPVEGATITMLQGGEPLGRGVVSGGVAIVPLEVPEDPSLPVIASASLDDDVSVWLNTASLYMPSVQR